MSFASLTALGTTSNVLNARVRLPAWGIWSALVTLDRGDVNLTGPVVLTFGPLTLQGTIRRGQAFVGRGQYRIFGGADGWSQTIPAHSYRGPANLSTIAKDAAALVGETVVMDQNGEKLIGPYARMEGYASDLLNLYTPGRWWVENDGITHIGDRASIPAPSVRVLDFDPDRGIVTYSDDSLFVSPAQSFNTGTISGTVSTVFHDLEGGTLRSEIYLQ